MLCAARSTKYKGLVLGQEYAVFVKTMFFKSKDLQAEMIEVRDSPERDMTPLGAMGQDPGRIPELSRLWRMHFWVDF